MNHIFYIMGKSSSGKDTIYQNILNCNTMKMLEIYSEGFQPIIMHTTRPMRAGEIDGVQYKFIDEIGYKFLHAPANKIIEERVYETVHGKWAYITSANDINLEYSNYIGIGTLESYTSLCDYYGKEVMVPIYIEIDEYDRAVRALNRELKGNQDYNEMYRRLRQDLLDFSEENLEKAGITSRDRYYNDDLNICTYNIINKIHNVVFGNE